MLGSTSGLAHGLGTDWACLLDLLCDALFQETGKVVLGKRERGVETKRPWSRDFAYVSHARYWQCNSLPAKQRKGAALWRSVDLLIGGYRCHTLG